MAETIAQAAETAQVSLEEEPIRGKVAAVLGEERLVLNVGTDHGVTRKMVFRITGTRVIRDPDTGDKLGEVEVMKIKVQVGEVRERLSIAHPYEEYSPGDYFLGPTLQFFTSKDIKPAPRSLTGGVQHVEVSVGDLAVSD